MYMYIYIYIYIYIYTYIYIYIYTAGGNKTEHTIKYNLLQAKKKECTIKKKKNIAMTDCLVILYPA